MRLVINRFLLGLFIKNNRISSMSTEDGAVLFDVVLSNGWTSNMDEWKEFNIFKAWAINHVKLENELKDKKTS